MGLSINKQTNKQIAQVRFDAHFRSLSVNGGGGVGGEEEEETTSSTSRTLTTIRTTTTRTRRRHRRRKAGGQGGSSRKQKVHLMRPHPALLNKNRLSSTTCGEELQKIGKDWHSFNQRTLSKSTKKIHQF